MNKRRVLLGMLMVLSLALTARAVAQPPAPTQQGTAASPNLPDQPAAPGHQPDMLSTTPGVLVSTESLLGVAVKNAQGQDVGELKHLMIDSRTGRVMYAVVAMGGFLGMGRKTLVVPWSAMSVARKGNALVLNLSPRTGPQAPASADPRHEDSDVSSAPVGEQHNGGWGAETPYGRLYDPAQEQTISGQVSSIETAAPMPGMAPGMQLLVQTDDGKTVRVHIGPEWYLQRQNVALQAHTRVQVTGATADIEGQPVLMARAVQFDGQILTLRDAQGLPVWNSLRRSAAR
jgi:sporulation protein YlmC with PRC-barrel domain